MYTEASSPREPGDITRMSTDFFAPSNLSDTVCVRFHYHMYGATIGTIRVFVREKGSSNIGSHLWDRSAQKGNEWIPAQFNYKPGLNDYQVSVRFVLANVRHWYC